MLGRRKKVKAILSNYSDFLQELCDTLNANGLQIDLPGLMSEAVSVLEDRLADSELSALLQIEGTLKGKFPGVENRIKRLLGEEITDSLFKRVQ